jgi:hypothetical protein
MGHDEQRKNGSATPEERFQELEKQSAEWSARVDKSVRALDRMTKSARSAARRRRAAA